MHLLEFGVNLSGRKEPMRFAPAQIDWSKFYRPFTGPLAKAAASLS